MKLMGINIDGVNVYQEHGHYLLQKNNKKCDVILEN